MTKTTSPLRLLFDECIGWPVVDQLANLVAFDSAEYELEHAIRLGFGGVKDEIWIPQIADDGWLIITGDDGKRRKAGSGEKLPVVCRQCGVTYAVLSRSVRKLHSFQKVRVLLAVWESLASMREAPRGSGFSIRPASENSWKLALTREAPKPFIPPSILAKKQQDLNLPQDAS